MDDTTMSNLRPGSFTSLVAELNPGESVSKVRAVDPTMTIARMPDEMPSLRDQLRNICQPSIKRAKAVVKNATYTCEVGDMVMPSGSPFVVAVVTRLS